MIDEFFQLLQGELELNGYKCNYRKQISMYRQLSVIVNDDLIGYITHYVGEKHFSCVGKITYEERDIISIELDSIELFEKVFGFFNEVSK